MTRRRRADRAARESAALVAASAMLLVAALATPGSVLGATRKTGAVLPGGNSGKPISVEAGKLDYFDKEQKLVYTGNVVATQGDAKMKASVLTIFLAPKGGAPATAGSTNQVQKMLMTGPVTLLQRDQVGTGENGVYDKASDAFELNGNVTLSQGPNVTKGDRLTYNLKSGQAVVTGHVKSMFIPSDNPGGDRAEASAPSRRPTRERSGAGEAAREF